jgi:hypothetical protein
VVLRRDGNFDSDDPDELQLREWSEKSFIGYDMNGGELQFTMDDRRHGTWKRLNDPRLHIDTGTVVSDLNRALDRYIELLSAGKIEEFLAEGGAESRQYETYRGLKGLADESKESNDAYDFLKKTADGEEILAQSGEDHFREAMKKALLEYAIQSVHMPFMLQELKRLRNATPRIASRTPFSPEFEAVYTLPRKEPSQSQIVRRMTGHGSKWTFHEE